MGAPGFFSGEEAGEEGGSEGGVDTAGLLEVDAEDDRIGKGWKKGWLYCNGGCHITTYCHTVDGRNPAPPGMY